MSKRFYLPRILGLIAAITCTCVTLAIAAQVTPSKQTAAADASVAASVAASTDVSGDITLDATAPEDKGQLPPVVFDHNRHTGHDITGETCARCHDPEDSTHAFLPVADKAPSDLEAAYHAGCVSCHAATKDKGMKAGPLQAECRSCHDAAALPEAEKDGAKADGGLDASLHARHVASAMIVSPGSDDNCAACHHAVKAPVSPKLEADSCRSCHPPSGSRVANSGDAAPKNVPFRDVAHKKCVSCHQDFAAKNVKTALVCASCHDAGIKAGHAKLSPRPRLEAGQPDTILMGIPDPSGAAALPAVPPPLDGALPDKQAGEGTQKSSSMPLVVFDHKLHEAASDTCITCHHNTLQTCSTCHTPQGSAEGKNVTQTTAMHLSTSSRSCVGCHETRKTTVSECASCHGAMPAKTTDANCASCHNSGQISPAADSLRLKPPVQPDLSAGPDTVTIGVLSDEFEPSVFPHKQILEKLTSGIQDTLPGMMRFHASPQAICASCHHNSPPSATPPSCASCHDKSLPASGKRPPDNRPLLKVAYHQQCMSCHTRMNITEPANTDCAGCHTRRIQSGKTGGGK